MRPLPRTAIELAEEALLQPRATGRPPIGSDPAPGVVLGHNELAGKRGEADFYHLSTAEYGVVRDNQPFGAGGVVYADASSKLATDAANLTWDAANKWLGIGTPTPLQQLHMVSDGGMKGPRVDVAAGASATNCPLYTTQRSRGTIAAPTAVLDNDYIYSERHYGYGTAWGQECYRFLMRADEDWSAANRGVWWRVYGVHPGTTALAEWLRVEDGQHRFPAGTAAKPPITFINYPTMGMYAAGATTLAWSIGGVRKMALDTATGHFTVGHSANPVYAFEVRYGIAGLLTAQFYNTSAVAGAGLRMYFRAQGTGDSWGLWRSGVTDWSVGHDASEANRWVWGAANVLGGATDRMRLERVGVWWLFPHSPTLGVDGQAAMDSAHETFRWRMGTMQCLGASLLDTARVADATVSSVGGTLALTTVSSQVTDSTYNVSGNTVKILAKGTAVLYPRGSAGNSTMHIYFRIEGTNVLDLVFSAVYGEGPTWITFEFSCEATIRGSTSWEITNVKGQSAESSEGASPWPYQIVPTGEIWYARDTPFVVSGDVTTYVRCSIANSTGGVSTCTVHKHQNGLEQT